MTTQEATTVERVYPPKLMFMVANPIMKWMLSTRLGKRVNDLALLQFKGRKTGTDYKLVSAIHQVDGRAALLTNSGWRHNFAGGHPVTATIGGEKFEMVGTLQAQPEAVARVYAEKIKELGQTGASRRLGVKIDGPDEPTLEQLTDLTRDVGLSVIYLDPVAD